MENNDFVVGVVVVIIIVLLLGILAIILMQYGPPIFTTVSPQQYS